MPSRDASGQPLRRIKSALSNWYATCYVHWKQLCAERLFKDFDQTRYSQQQVARLMHEHVEAGGSVREQDEVEAYRDERFWYSIVLTLAGKDQFIKFVLRPDIEDEPGIVIVSFHEQNR